MRGVFFGLMLLGCVPCAFAADLPGSPGWTYYPTPVSSGYSQDPGTETEWVRLVPPNGQPVVVGASVIRKIEGGAGAQATYDEARRAQTETMNNLKTDWSGGPGTGSGIGSANTDANAGPLATGTSTGTSTSTDTAIATGGGGTADGTGTGKEKDDELVWDLGRPLPTPRPLIVAPPPPAPQWSLVGLAQIWSIHRKELPAATCQRLKPGEFTLVEHDIKVKSPIDMEARYLLRRENADEYTAELNLKFVRGKGFDILTMKDEEIDPHYRRLANGCLEKFAPAFRNETTGQRLKVRLSKDPALKPTEVKIGEARRRSSMNFWESDIECAALLHEVFHHFGLPDEYDEQDPMPQAKIEATYEETDTGKRRTEKKWFEARFDCRAIAPTASLMNWHEEAASQAQIDKVKVDRCYCDKGVDCTAVKKKLDAKAKACPKGSRVFTRMIEVQPGVPYKPDPDDAESFLLAHDYDATIGKGKPGRSAIFHPAHFRAITEPGCGDVNWRYYACARNAYRFGRDFPADWQGLGLQRLDYQGCLPAPADCQHGYEWLK